MTMIAKDVMMNFIVLVKILLMLAVVDVLIE